MAQHLKLPKEPESPAAITKRLALIKQLSQPAVFKSSIIPMPAPIIYNNYTYTNTDSTYKESTIKQNKMPNSFLSKDKSRLPKQYYEDSILIGKMKLGAQGYAVGWAMGINTEGYAFLNPGYAVYPQKMGTVELPIKLLEDGYHVYLGGVDYRWNDHFGNDGTWLYVTEIHESREPW